MARARPRCRPAGATYIRLTSAVSEVPSTTMSGPGTGRGRHVAEVAHEEGTRRLLEVRRVDRRLVAAAVARDVLLLDLLDEECRVRVGDRHRADHQAAGAVHHVLRPGPESFGADRIGRVSDIVIPEDLRPADGRFGAGPSKVHARALDALAATGSR